MVSKIIKTKLSCHPKEDNVYLIPNEMKTTEPHIKCIVMEYKRQKVWVIWANRTEKKKKENQ